MTFTFDKNYKNHEQVREYMPAFLAAFAELDPTMRFAYNDQFRGRVAGIEGPCEDTAIYLLQTLKHLDELNAKVAEYLANGWVEVEATEAPVKYKSIVHYGFYMGGTGWQEWHDARLRLSRGHYGSAVVLPKGKRTHGQLLSGKIIAKG